jgi:predicted AlkP superfamily phosphohydrolase/phosphomutase
MKNKKVIIIGLDSCTPQLLFDKWPDLQPNIQKLIQGGVYGPLTSCIPAITVPAWMSMVTSKTPGDLGFYGFRNRKDYSYDELFLASSVLVKELTVWDIISRHDKKVIVVGVPPSFPPKPVNGCLISCFLTPGINANYTYPPELKSEIPNAVGKYLFDVPKFRTEDKDDFVKQVYELADNRFATFKYLLQHKEWDFAMMVEMGVDRLHHGMWKYADPEHHKFEPGNKYENVIRDYYRYIDQKIGTILEIIDENTVVLVVSDHGMQRMDGGICFNDWLIQQGYLVLKDRIPEKPVPLKNEMIDWEKTSVWGSGGYYGRVFINVEGREPQGIIPMGEYEKFRTELQAKIAQISGPDNKILDCKAFKPQEIYPQVKGYPPDLIVYFGKLFWRSVGTVGNPSIWTYENDTGPDDANHAQRGIFVMNAQNQHHGQLVPNLHIMDVAPTVLDLMGIEIPTDMRGESVLKKINS